MSSHPSEIRTSSEPIFKNIYAYSIKSDTSRPLVKKLISLPTKPPTTYHIGGVVKSPLKSEWFDSKFSNYEKMATSTTFSALFLRSLLPTKTKKFRPTISFRVKTTDIDKKYDIY